MQLVNTTKGEIARDRLITTDIVSEEPGCRVIATEWHLDGELVRRDVWVSILKGQEVAGEQASLT